VVKIRTGLISEIIPESTVW